jgi:anti-sigma factor ChrR (cupin superfamily)
MAIEKYGDNQSPSAIVIRKSAKSNSIEFFTPQDFSQQLGLMTRPAGYIVPAHVHNLVERTIFNTQEVLFIRNGICKVVLYEGSQSTETIILEAGDVILLAQGGHEIEMVTECEILEVKQGPYAGEHDKTKIFQP